MYAAFPWGQRGARALVLAAAIMMSASAPEVLAQSAETTGDRARLGKAHRHKGDAYQRQGSHALAIVEYQAGFAVWPQPEFLFSIAVSYERLAEEDPDAPGQDAAAERAQLVERRSVLENARHYYSRFIDEDPDHPSVSGAGALLAALAPRREAIERRIAALDAQVSASTPADVSAVGVAQSRTPRRSGRLRLASYFVGGAGLVSIALAAKFGLDARSASRDLSAHRDGPWTDELVATSEEGESAETRMVVFAGMGVVCLGSAVAMYFLGGEKTPDLAVIPTMTGDLAGVAVHGWF